MDTLADGDALVTPSIARMQLSLCPIESSVCAFLFHSFSPTFPPADNWLFVFAEREFAGRRMQERSVLVLEY